MEDIASGVPSFVIGTHALFQEKVQFNNLGFVVTDEQHRFGVAQRSALADGEVVEIERGDVEIITSEMPGWAVVTDGNLTVALDLTVTPELKNEGVSREIVKRIQNHRKESGFEITDRIRVTLSNHPEIEEAVNSFHDYIAAQVLADELRCAEIPAGTDGAVTFDFGDFTIEAVIER